MIKRFTYGRPYQTDSVVTKLADTKGAPDFGKVSKTGGFSWTYKLDKDDAIFGLGETMRNINKRGYEFISWNSDQPDQDESVKSLYGSHNFIIIFGKKTFAVYFDYPGKLTFDLGYTNQDEINVHCDKAHLDVYFITPKEKNNSLKDLVQQFRVLTGSSYIPPRWAFGFSMSRWGYKTQKDFETVWKKYRKLGIPMDSICMDIDYMTDYEDFTLDEKKFPEFDLFARKLRKDGVRLVPIIDAGIKKQEGYSVYDEAVKKGYDIKKKDGEQFVGGVWPGDSVFPDFLNPEARSWFGQKYQVLTSRGIEGFWNDMNEPALFYSKETLSKAYEKFDELRGKPLDVKTFFEFKDIGKNIANNPEDYSSFYHSVPAKIAGGFALTKPDKDGNVLVCHSDVHNIFGFNMTRGAQDAFKTFDSKKRTLIYSRSSYIGAHRYGGIWTGDNHSYWQDILLSLHQMASLNMTGFMFTGSDIGGFNADTTRDLLLRWLSFGIFTPLCRNHSANGTRNQEFYEYEKPEDFKSVLDLRYALIPYLYSEFVKASLKDEMYFRPLAFDYQNDARAVNCEDQIMLGDGIMLAPVYVQNAKGRYVYLPENMVKVVWQGGKVKSQETLKAGDHFVEMPLNAVVFFVKKGHIVPLCKPAKDSDSLDTSKLTIVGDEKKGVFYELYEDDGYTTEITMAGRVRKVSR